MFNKIMTYFRKIMENVKSYLTIYLCLIVIFAFIFSWFSEKTLNIQTVASWERGKCSPVNIFPQNISDEVAEDVKILIMYPLTHPSDSLNIEINKNALYRIEKSKKNTVLYIVISVGDIYQGEWLETINIEVKKDNVSLYPSKIRSYSKKEREKEIKTIPPLPNDLKL